MSSGYKSTNVPIFRWSKGKEEREKTVKQYMAIRKKAGDNVSILNYFWFFNDETCLCIYTQN